MYRTYTKSEIYKIVLLNCHNAYIRTSHAEPADMEGYAFLLFNTSPERWEFWLNTS